MRFSDAITGAVLVVFAFAEIAYTRTFPSLHGQDYGPNLFPVLIGVGLIGCGCLLILRGLLARRELKRTTANADAVSWIDSANISDSNQARFNAVLVVLIPLVYIFLSDKIGFFLLSFIAISILIYRLGSSIGVSLVVAIVATTVIQFLFARILLVPLPAGLLTGFI